MKQHSFTLIELIVVIFIIALILAVISPVLRISQQHAKAVLCNSNIKQLTIGLLIYDVEKKRLPYSFYNEAKSPPPIDGYSGNKLCDRTGWWWFNFIKDFYRKSDAEKTVVQCPSKWLANPKLRSDILCGNYGVNRSICKSFDDRQKYREEFVGIPLSIKDIPNPSKTLLVVDSGYAMINWWYATDVPPVALGNNIIEDTAYIPGLKINKNRALQSGQEQDAINGRHPNKTVNIGFSDGHISRLKADDLFVEKEFDNYKNKTPLWVP